MPLLEIKELKMGAGFILWILLTTLKDFLAFVQAKKIFRPSCFPPWALLYRCLRSGDLERNSDSLLLFLALLVVVLLPQV